MLLLQYILLMPALSAILWGLGVLKKRLYRLSVRLSEKALCRQEIS